MTPANRAVRLALIGLTLAAGVAGQYWLTVQPDPTMSATAWIVAALGAVVLYFVGRDAADLPPVTTGEMSRRAELGWLALVILIGVFFVCYRIDQIPAGLNHDAAWEGLYAIRILNGEPYTPYTSEAWGRETLTFYFRAAAIWLMGPTLRAVQAPGMLAGVLTLPLFYIWARTMFGIRLALMATLFLAASGWHLVFSRTGWRSDFQPMFMAMTGCFFLRGLERARLMDFILAGLGLALTLNIYNAARVYPAVFALWVVLLVVQSWYWRGFIRRYWLGLLFMAVTFAIAIAPLAYFAFYHWDTFQGRAAALRGASTLQASLRSSLLLFNRRGNGDDFFIDEPALELPAAVLFVFGLVWCLLRWRDERAQLLLIGMVIGLVPGMVSKPNLNRDIGTMVFVYFLVGLGAMFFAQQLRRALGGVGRYAATGLLVLAGLAAMVAAYTQFLGDQRRPIWG
ncbi:MAG TPA: glycosyltransferase family 39 protein, partial [Terriglobales bacterium]|nr:glycosyltransferase family 39 protein [Terriglobales bacterium]